MVRVVERSAYSEKQLRIVMLNTSDEREEGCVILNPAIKKLGN